MGSQNPTGTNNSQVELALEIAFTAHRGQTDLDGSPAILHPLHVGMAGTNAIEQCVGFLHDVAEDSHLTFNDLRNNLQRSIAGGHSKQVKKHSEALDYLLRNEEHYID